MGRELVWDCVDDASRLASVDVLGNEQAITATGFLDHALDSFGRRGIRARRVMTAPFVSKRWTALCSHRALGMRSPKDGLDAA